MICPRCKTVLTRKTIRDFDISVDVDYCTGCGGSWFDKGELEQLEKTIEPTFLEIRRIPDRKDQMEPLICPSCENHQILQKAEHPRDRKVIFDYCPTCKGIWLDSGELEAIQEENWILTIGKFFKWLLNIG
jgi:uncharacterized protein